MKIRGKNLMKLLAGAIPLLMLFGCEIDTEQIPAPGTGDEAMITFSIQLPGASAPASRAMTETDENAIKSIHVVAFKDGVYSYQASGTSIQSNGGVSKKKFTVVLRKGVYDLVIVANAPAAINWNNLVGKSKAAAMNLLETTSPTNGQWAASGKVEAIPMWGNVGQKDVGTATIPETPLLRMVARVNVTLTETNSKFKLNTVNLYNYNTKGLLAPSQADWGKTSVTAPNLPTSPGRTQGPASFTATTAGVSCINEIYMFEAAKGSKSTLTTNPCIVVGGTYDGSPAFYRIDFATDADNYLAIMRNHSYNISITGVKNAGHPKAQDAFEAGPENITVKILEWDNGGMGNVGFDGQNYLSVSQDEFSFPNDAINTVQDNNVLYVNTDVAGGWKVEKIVDAANGTTPVTWVKATTNGSTTITGGGANTETRVVLAVTKITGATADRSAIIWIVAGRLRYPVKVMITATEYVGMFGGALVGMGGVWQFTKPLYVQNKDESTGIKWQTSDIDSGVTTDNMNGRQSTYNLRSTTFPAANLCYNKNGGTPTVAGMTWYLPALKQLDAVYVVNESFATANKLSQAYYWSATEYAAPLAGAVDFSNGNTSIQYDIVLRNFKTTTRQVRCVREL